MLLIPANEQVRVIKQSVFCPTARRHIIMPSITPRDFQMTQDVKTMGKNLCRKLQVPGKAITQQTKITISITEFTNSGT